MRTLVVRLGALGDAVLTLPALAHLLAAGDEVTVLGVPASWGFLPETSPLRIEDVEAPRWRGLFAGDAVEAARGHGRAFVMLASADVAATLSRDGLAAVHVPPVRPGEAGMHAARRLLAGVGGSESDADAVRSLIASEAGGDPHDLVIHPGSGGRAKRWPAERFAALAGGARTPLVLLGPADRDLAADFDGLPVALDWSLRQIAATLAVARAFVGNDSGITHLASWLCPTLALFGPTDPAVWSPTGPFARVLAAPERDLSRLAVDEVRRQLARL